MKTILRENVISHLSSDKSSQDSAIIFEFIAYLQAYCAELKRSEWDVLLNDEHYDSVFGLFDFIVLQNKPELVS